MTDVHIKLFTNHKWKKFQEICFAYQKFPYFLCLQINGRKVLLLICQSVIVDKKKNFQNDFDDLYNFLRTGLVVHYWKMAV